MQPNDQEEFPQFDIIENYLDGMYCSLLQSNLHLFNMYSSIISVNKLPDSFPAADLVTPEPLVTPPGKRLPQMHGKFIWFNKLLNESVLPKFNYLIYR